MKLPDETFWKSSNGSTDLKSLSYAKKVFAILKQGYSVEMNIEAPATIETKQYQYSMAFETSGTTGYPKRCVHSWSGLENAYKRLERFLNLDQPLHTVSCLPIHHIGGWMQVARAWFSGGNVLFTNYRDFRNPKCEDLFIGRYVSLVPAQLYELLKSEHAIRNLRYCKGIFLGGAACNDLLLKKARGAKLPIYICYGMTETAGMITILDKEDFANGVEGVGQELPNVSMRLSNDNRICVQCESFGELEVEKTVFSSGWFITSDIGELKNGYWKISHRADKIVNSGGEKIIPDLIEKHILEFPQVKTCFISSIEDVKWGQRLIAYVSPESVNADELKSFLKTKLQKFEVPKSIFPVKEAHLHSDMNWKKET
ncbi:MAG: hypothetical protein CMI24_02855 [Opitutae bacterium]|nr:hypothetical protein [Opitutae bacterium]